VKLKIKCNTFWEAYIIIFVAKVLELAPPYRVFTPYGIPEFS